MDYAQQSNAKSQYNLQQQAASTYPQETTAAPMSASESIIARLNSIRMALAENRSNANHAAEKIVGSAPTPLAGATGQIKGEHPPACCFIDALQQVIGDIEDIARDTAEHLNRLHRSF